MRSLPLPILRLKYERSAQAYMRSLKLEDFMESTGQAEQRRITLASLELVHAQRPDVQLFNELLIQYPLEDGSIGKVVPDNMVVVYPEPIQADGSYDIPLQPVRPTLVLEYVSKKSERKDTEETFAKYEKHVKAPYGLTKHPGGQRARSGGRLQYFSHRPL